MAIDMNDLPKLPDMRLELRKTGSPEWHRAYIYTPDGIDIGYINFLKGEFFNFRFRRSEKSKIPLDERDLIATRLVHYQNTGEILSEERYEWAVHEARGSRAQLRHVLDHSNIPVEVTFG